MKSNKAAALGALRRPVSFRDAAKLLGVSQALIRAMVESLELMTVRVDGRDLIPSCELQRFRPKSD